MELVPQEQSHAIEVADEGIYDQNAPKSLYNLLPASMQEHLLRTKNSFLTDLSTESIRKNIRYTPEYKLCQKVRTAFWIEYDAAVSGNRKMKMTRIWQGLCDSSGQFYSLFKEDHFAAWIFTKPTSKAVREQTILQFAYEQIEDIMCASHYNKDGTLNPYTAKIKVDIWKHLEERVNGGILKRVAVQSEQKNINVNVEANANQYLEMKRAEELQAKLAELKEQTKDLEAIEASSKIVTDDEYDY